MEGTGKNPWASLDLGSNTFRLLIARPSSPIPERIVTRLETTRLAAGLEREGRLDKEAVRRGLEVIRSFIGEARRLEVNKMVAVGTGALRRAVDGREFAGLVHRETGLVINIIDQEIEARLSMLGVRSVLGGDRDLVAVDIGGRSTEIIFQPAVGELKVYGLDLGAVSLHESFLRSDPPTDEEVGSLKAFLGRHLSSCGLNGSIARETVLAGTGGTYTTLVALEQELTEYDPALINGRRLGRERIEEILGLLLELRKERRADLPGMEPGRADIIIAGLLLALALLGLFQRDEMVVSDSGLLEGALLAVLSDREDLVVTPADRLLPGR